MNSKGGEFLLERVDEVDAFCFAHCVKSVPSGGVTRPRQEVCLHNCYRKALSAFEFIAEYERMAALRPQ